MQILEKDDNMEKGFTLIELLAVIVIVGVISSIAFITVDKSIKDSKNNLYNTQVNTIYDGAQAWATDNISKLDGKDFYCITLKTLQDSGYVQKNIINPKDDKEFDSNLKIKITDTISGYNYSIDEIDGC